MHNIIFPVLLFRLATAVLLRRQEEVSRKSLVVPAYVSLNETQLVNANNADDLTLSSDIVLKALVPLNFYIGFHFDTTSSPIDKTDLYLAIIYGISVEAQEPYDHDEFELVLADTDTTRPIQFHFISDAPPRTTFQAKTVIWTLTSLLLLTNHESQQFWSSGSILVLYPSRKTLGTVTFNPPASSSSSSGWASCGTRPNTTVISAAQSVVAPPSAPTTSNDTAASSARLLSANQNIQLTWEFDEGRQLPLTGIFFAVVAMLGHLAEEDGLRPSQVRMSVYLVPPEDFRLSIVVVSRELTLDMTVDGIYLLAKRVVAESHVSVPAGMGILTSDKLLARLYITYGSGYPPSVDVDGGGASE